MNITWFVRFFYMVLAILLCMLLAKDETISSKYNSHEQKCIKGNYEIINKESNYPYIIDSALICRQWRLVEANLNLKYEKYSWYDDYDNPLSGKYTERLFIKFYSPICTLYQNDITRDAENYKVVGKLKIKKSHTVSFHSLWRTKKDSILICMFVRKGPGGITWGEVFLVGGLCSECAPRNIDNANSCCWKQYFIKNDTLQIVSTNQDKFIFVSERK